MSSFWRNFHHWLHWRLSFWQLAVQPVMKISSKWRHFRFSGRQKLSVPKIIQSQYNDVIISVMASQITSISTVNSTICLSQHKKIKVRVTYQQWSDISVAFFTVEEQIRQGASIGAACVRYISFWALWQLRLRQWGCGIQNGCTWRKK